MGIDEFAEESGTWVIAEPFSKASETGRVLEDWLNADHDVVPFILDDDPYMHEEIGAFVRSTVVECAGGGLRMPVKHAKIPSWHAFRNLSDSRARTEADLLFGIVATSWLFPSGPGMQDWEAAVSKHLNYLGTRFLICSGIQNLLCTNLHLELDWVVDKATSLGCRIAFVGGLATWLNLQSTQKVMRHRFRPVNIASPSGLSAEFAETLNAASGGAVTQTVAADIWAVANGNRVQAVALASTLGQLRYEGFNGEISKELLGRLAGIAQHASSPDIQCVQSESDFQGRSRDL